MPRLEPVTRAVRPVRSKSACQPRRRATPASLLVGPGQHPDSRPTMAFEPSQGVPIVPSMGRSGRRRGVSGIWAASRFSSRHGPSANRSRADGRSAQHPGSGDLPGEGPASRCCADWSGSGSIDDWPDCRIWVRTARACWCWPRRVRARRRCSPSWWRATGCPRPGTGPDPRTPKRSSLTRHLGFALGSALADPGIIEAAGSGRVADLVRRLDRPDVGPVRLVVDDLHEIAGTSGRGRVGDLPPTASADRSRSRWAAGAARPEHVPAAGVR